MAKKILKSNTNIELLVDSFIDRLNTQAEQANLQRHYSYRIIKGKTPLNNTKENIQKGGKALLHHYRTFKFVVADLDNNERTTLYENDYVATNPSEFLKGTYKKILFREFLYNCFGVFSINMENTIKTEVIKDNITNFSFNVSG